MTALEWDTEISKKLYVANGDEQITAYTERRKYNMSGDRMNL
jgi:hypothetical protein